MYLVFAKNTQKKFKKYSEARKFASSKKTSSIYSLHTDMTMPLEVTRFINGLEQL